MRTVGGLDTETFIGPTMAALGVGFIIPLTIVENYASNVQNFLSDEAKTKVKEGDFQVIRGKDYRFMNICQVALVVATLVWMFTLVVSTKYAKEVDLPIYAYYLPGLLNYFGGVTLAEFKEGL